MKTVRVTLEIPVLPLSQEVVDRLNDAEKESYAKSDEQDEGDEVEEFVPPTPDEFLDETTADELAQVVEYMFHQDAIDEAFGGSDVYATFGTEGIKIVSAEFVEVGKKKD